MLTHQIDEKVQAQAYDEIPYESYAFSQTQPARLAATAHLLGLTPPDVHTARVLEIGCAAGGNLIPLAAYYPEATFVGIDISGKQIDDGCARIAALGLTNIRLLKASITDCTPEDGIFDYILSHGVYSWVSDHVRKAVMRVSSQNLSDQGVAYISYNVYPGWHMKKTVRDMMLYHTADIADGQRKIDAARSILATIRPLAEGSYAEVLKAEAQHLRSEGDYYLRHEQLVEDNNPFYFHEFIKDCASEGLAYLAEADLPYTSLQAYPAKIALQVRQAAGDDYLKQQQYLDFFLGRTFRMSLVVKADNAERINRRIAPDRLTALHFSLRSSLEPSHAGSDSSSDSFESGFSSLVGDHETLFIQAPAAIKAINILRQVAKTVSSSFTLFELLTAVAAPDERSANDFEIVSSLLLEMICRKMLWFSSVALPSSAGGYRPKAFDLVLADIRQGRSMTTNRQHDRIHFSSPSSALFISLLDGTRNRSELEEHVLTLVESGNMRFESAVARFEEYDNLQQAAHEFVKITLAHVGRLQLLIE